MVLFFVTSQPILVPGSPNLLRPPIVVALGYMSEREGSAAAGSCSIPRYVSSQKTHVPILSAKFRILSISVFTGIKPVGLFGMFRTRSFVLGEIFSARKLKSRFHPHFVSCSGHLIILHPSALGIS